MTPRRLPRAVSGHDRRTFSPLTADYLTSWPPRGCNWCGDAEIVWAYPVGPVTFPRVDPDTGTEVEVEHPAQQWYACSQCKPYIDGDFMDDLSDVLDMPRGYWDRLMKARIKSPGFPWRNRPGQHH